MHNIVALKIGDMSHLQVAHSSYLYATYKQCLSIDELCNKERDREMEKSGDVFLTLSWNPEPQFS